MLDEAIVLRIQGAVWRTLKALLAKSDVQMTKPSHRDGYEVDARIASPNSPLLVEIKTSTRAADVQTGIDQLELYPRLIHSVAGHRRILLVPDEPIKASMLTATAKCDVTVCTYRYKIRDGSVEDICIDPTFLGLCGVV